MSVSTATGRYGEGPQYSNSASCICDYPTNDTRDIIDSALRGLGTIWRDGYRYAKASLNGTAKLRQLNFDSEGSFDLSLAAYFPATDFLCLKQCSPAATIGGCYLLVSLGNQNECASTYNVHEKSRNAA
ncbi:hypothetical protein [Pantoea sp. SM3]|uniref:hypothetical protein n=1 Tax=Pantoea sp. SM3 TaxID=1628192 RepID=UPI00350EDBC3